MRNNYVENDPIKHGFFLEGGVRGVAYCTAYNDVTKKKGWNGEGIFNYILSIFKRVKFPKEKG